MDGRETGRPGKAEHPRGSEVPEEETARVVFKDRPEIAACLDGMVFFGQEDATALLLRAAMVNVATGLVEDFAEDESIPAFVDDLQARTSRLLLAGKALQRDLALRTDPQARTRARALGYAAEIREFLRGPIPPLELSQGEARFVSERAEASLRKELRAADEAADEGGDRRVAELRAMVADTAEALSNESACLVARIPRPRLAEWLAQWRDEAIDEGSIDSPAAALLREIENRLHGRQSGKGMKLRKSSPIVPRRFR